MFGNRAFPALIGVASTAMALLAGCAAVEPPATSGRTPNQHAGNAAAGAAPVRSGDASRDAGRGDARPKLRAGFIVPEAQVELYDPDGQAPGGEAVPVDAGAQPSAATQAQPFAIAQAPSARSEPNATRATKPRIRLPGSCVDTEEHAAQQLAKMHPRTSVDSWRDFAHVLRSPDLDGDGQKDEMRNGGATNMTQTWFVYVKRGRCGHWVGTIATEALVQPLETTHRGLLDLGGHQGCQVDCCRILKYEEWYFDGRRYRLGATRDERRDCSQWRLP